jgi:hypothetical protein
MRKPTYLRYRRILKVTKEILVNTYLVQTKVLSP